MLCAGRPLYWSSSASTRRSIMTFSTFSFSMFDHDRNYIFGDSLVRDEALPHSESPALQFQVRAVAKTGRARAAQMQLPHFLCETPMFMPVGTQGVKLAFLVFKAVCKLHALAWPVQRTRTTCIHYYVSYRNRKRSHSGAAGACKSSSDPGEHIPSGKQAGSRRC